MATHAQEDSHGSSQGISQGNPQELRDWIGRTEKRTQQAHGEPIAALSATLDRDDPPPHAGTPVPPLWHWVYFTPQYRASDTGPDGHAKRGGFLPPVPLPRRMWAGGRLAFHHPLQVGDDIERTSTVADVRSKSGRTGELVFVLVRHEIRNTRGLALSEEHDIVYRDMPAAASGAAAADPKPAPTDDTFRREIVPDPVLLFRYSALTFNGHRIHYDRSYVTEVEGYPGLIVHGPLIATLLVDLLRRERPRETLRSFSFRAVSPIFDIHRFTVCGRPDGEHGYALWARDHRGALAMEATAETAAASAAGTAY